MKIKTIVRIDPASFDSDVNEFLEKGYLLGHRGTMFLESKGQTAHYAQMVLLDPLPEPETGNPFEALHTIKAACLEHKGPCDDCPLNDWCEQLAKGGDPTDWDLSVLEEADT